MSDAASHQITLLLADWSRGDEFARKSCVVEIKFFGGLNIEEIAGVLKISPETVKREWRFAQIGRRTL